MRTLDRSRHGAFLISLCFDESLCHANYSTASVASSAQHSRVHPRTGSRNCFENKSKRNEKSLNLKRIADECDAGRPIAGFYTRAGHVTLPRRRGCRACAVNCLHVHSGSYPYCVHVARARLRSNSIVSEARFAIVAIRSSKSARAMQCRSYDPIIYVLNR